MNFFASTLYAQTEAASNDPGLMGQLVLFGLIFLIFYFLIIRPNSKKTKAHKEMVDALVKGDKVILASGIYGTINKMEPDKIYCYVEIADKVVVKVQNAQLLQKVETVPKKAEKSEKADKAEKSEKTESEN